MMNRIQQLVILSCISGPLLAYGQASADKSASEQKITFEEHIKPIFREHCTACHSASDKESDLALDSYAATLSGGSSGEVIKAGDSGSSRLFGLLAHVERPFMPPDQEAIQAAQIALVKTWIEQGMPENSGSQIKQFNHAAAAMLADSSAGKPEGPPPMPLSLLRQPVTETSRSAAISALAASPWAPLIAIGGQQQVCLYHAQSGELLGIVPFPEGEPQSLTFTRDGKQLLIGGGRHAASGCAVLVDIESGERLAKVGDELDVVLAADITPDKQRIAIAGPQRIVRIYDSVSGELVTELQKHTDWVFALRYSPDGVLLASGDRSNGLYLWEADTGRLYADLVGHKASVLSLDFRADSNVLASGSLDGTIKLWDMYESQAIKSWNAHRGGVTSVSFAQNGQIASAGHDATIKLWNGNGELQQEFQGLEEAALEVALTGDAAQVAGGDWNGRVQVWSSATPKDTKLIAANPASIESRLEQAEAALFEARAEFADAQQAQERALAGTSAAEEELRLTQARANQVAEHVRQNDQERAQIATAIDGTDVEIQALEEKLAALRLRRRQDVDNLQTLQVAQTQLMQDATSVAEELISARDKHANLAAQAEEARKQYTTLETKVDLAEKEKQRAVADLVALKARQEAIEQEHARAISLADELAVRIESTTEAEQTSADRTKQLEEQIRAMRDQLAEIQGRISSALKAETEAKQNLATTRDEKAKLQSELESAEQAAQAAVEQLRLFEQSYRRPE